MSLEDCNWMYEGWNDNCCHSEEWVCNTNAFVHCAFSDPNAQRNGIACPCSECRNRCRRKAIMSIHLCMRNSQLIILMV
jgi:hypothetical protein